jgi:mono/diheme cytochrome c family protein
MRATFCLLTSDLGLLLLTSPAPLRAQSEPVPPPRQPTSRTLVARTGDTRANRGTLQARCARCHDGDGTGKSHRDNLAEIPDFSNHKWQMSRTDSQLLVTILDGKGGHMPAYRGRLSEETARDLVAQIRGLDPQTSARRAEDPPSDFERRYRELQEELAELKKQFQDLTDPRRKP